MKKGFAVWELLVVITLVSVLTLGVVIMINPWEIRRKDRDITRLQDLSNLRQAIDEAVKVASASALCNGSISCRDLSTTGTKAINGTGWVKVDISGQEDIVLLPVDPVNSTDYHYTYCSNGTDWEINTVLESDQQIKQMSKDGGNEDNKYEIGSSLDLICTQF